MRRAVIVEAHHGNLLGQREQRADVVAVVVGGPQVIDPRDAGGRERLDDAAQIAVAGIAGVDEQRLPRGTDEEGRLAAPGVDGVDGQGAGTGLGHQADDPGGQTEGGDEYGAHVGR